VIACGEINLLLLADEEVWLSWFLIESSEGKESVLIWKFYCIGRG